MQPDDQTRLLKAGTITGPTVVLRNATTDDAEFVVKLRTESRIARYISETSPSLANQKRWLESYERATDQAYFMVCDCNGERLGTARLYDPIGKTFCFGSWIMRQGASSRAAVESLLLCYAYAVDHLGFEGSRFSVRKENESVWRFKESFGATRTLETEKYYHYEMFLPQIMSGRKKYEKFMSSYAVAGLVTS